MSLKKKKKIVRFLVERNNIIQAVIYVISQMVSRCFLIIHIRISELSLRVIICPILHSAYSISASDKPFVVWLQL